MLRRLCSCGGHNTGNWSLEVVPCPVHLRLLSGDDFYPNIILHQRGLISDGESL